ncbi:MAG: tRNA dihydrouridine synthase DusB [Bacteroidetes bacterium]|nr:tRNA dihydrouridine synthase DusB [Bacteroidota bacterium]MBL0016001.1 tRNA dihydrouridine synthase DusB [Bacteroidota bacterium]
MVKIAGIDIAEFPLLLAPMEDVSDPPFRMICKQQGADLVYTEFIAVDGLIRDADKSLQKLDIYDEERPVGIQIFGGEIEPMRQAVKYIERANPEFLDINYGCPVKKVVCKGAGAGILQDVDKMVAMTREIVQSTHLPVTVKTRLGWDENSIRIVEVALRLQDIGIKALSIHARTRAQMYKGEADWSWIKKVTDHPDIEIPIFGNGDVDSPEKAVYNKENYGVDGIMIGRAAIGHPWIFREVKHFMATGEHLAPPTVAERVEVCRNHLLAGIQWKGERTGIVEMRRHYTNYFKGMDHFKPFRLKLVSCDSLSEILETLDAIQEHFVLEAAGV